MTNDHQRQRVPNRRFRRLFPAAVAAITIASSAPFVLPAAAHAETPPPPRHEIDHAAPGKTVALPQARVVRGVRLQSAGST
jgi:hypothetical protein